MDENTLRLQNNGDMYVFKPFQFTSHETTSASYPRARSGHRIICTDRYLYSIGGYNPLIPDDDPEMSHDEIWCENKPLFKELWRFNLSTHRWKRIPVHRDLPIELASTAVLFKFGKLIIYGGTGVPFGVSCSNCFYTYDLKQNNVKKLDSHGTPPDPQYGQAIVSHGYYLYTVGGTTGYEYTCDIHRFDLRTGFWEVVYICSGRDITEPAGRYRHELAYDGNLIYVLGGGTARESFSLLEIPAFNLNTSRWSLLQTHGDASYNPGVPDGRRCHGAVQYADEMTGSISIIIFGGFTDNYVFDDVWKLDLKRLQWTRLKNHGLPRYFHAVSLTPAGKMYTFGGIIENNSDKPKRTDEVHSVWLKIPKLTEICWEALNHYDKNLRDRTQDELLDYGIPLEYIQRMEE